MDLLESELSASTLAALKEHLSAAKEERVNAKDSMVSEDFRLSQL